MALGGGPPLLSLLTGVAEGVTKGQAIQREREREAIMNALRQQQMENTRQIMGQRRDEEYRKSQLHEFALRAAEIGEESALFAAQTAQEREAERDQFVAATTQQIMEDLQVPAHQAQAQAVQLWERQQPYVTRLERERAAAQQDAVINAQNAQAETMRASAARTRREIELSEADEFVQGNNLQNLTLEQLNNMMPSFVDDYGMDRNEILNAYHRARQSPTRSTTIDRGTAELKGRQIAEALLNRSMVGEPGEDGKPTAREADPELALQILNQQLQSLETLPTREDALAFEKAFEYLEAKIKEKNKGVSLGGVNFDAEELSAIRDARERTGG